MLDLTFFAPNTIPPEAQQKTLDFWRSEGAVSAEVGQERVKQVICHASQDGQLMGVASGIIGVSRNLLQPYFHYRSYVAAGVRRQSFGTQLLAFSFDSLSDHFKAQPRPAAIGVLLEIPAEIAPIDPHLIWPQTGFIFTGKLENGAHQRVRYFEQVRMFARSQ